jgi:DNA polymerase-3 subunit delta
MNRDVFEGKDFSISGLIDALNTAPFFSERRVVYVRDSQLFATGRKDDTEAVSNEFPLFPDSTILVCVEANVDKRNRLYKKVAEMGRVVECKMPAESELIRWVNNIFKKKGKQIQPETVRLLLSTAPKNMGAIYAEADKIGDYAGERTQITDEDVQAICTQSVEARIFDLVGALCNGQTEKALLQYQNMMRLKEQLPTALAMQALTMMARQFRMVLQCKICAAQHMTPAKMASTLGLRDFMVREALQQGRMYTPERLMAALEDCQDIDNRIKSGQVDSVVGVEMLIVRYANRAK